MEATSPHFSNDFWHCGVTSDAFSGVDSVKRKTLPFLGGFSSLWRLGGLCPPLIQRLRAYVFRNQTINQTIFLWTSSFVYPSLYEGFGLPPLEAMSQVCPVISSNTSSMPEIIGNAGELFPPMDSDAMGKAIEAVVYSDSRRQAVISNGYERVKEFSWQKCSDQTLAIYSGLLG